MNNSHTELHFSPENMKNISAIPSIEGRQSLNNLTTRRKLIGGLSAIIAAHSCPAVISRSMLAARQTFLGRGGAKGWVNPYVTDGLVAMWDGEWNAGGGVHDANATIWKDLAGTNDLHLIGLSSFGENYFLSTAGAVSVGDPRIPVATAEAVIDTTGTNSWFVICYYRQVVGNMRWIGMRANDTVNFGNSADCMQGQRNGRNYYAGAYNTATQSVSLFMNGQTMPNLGPGMGGLGERYLSIAGTNPPFTCYAIRFYSRALTAAEIAANYAIDAQRFNLPTAS